jgi:hypothetical protein
MVDLANYEPQRKEPENFLGWSKPIQQPQGDKSGEILGSTIGKAITGSAEVEKDAVKNYSAAGAENIMNESIDTAENIQGRIQQAVNQNQPGQGQGDVGEPLSIVPKRPGERNPVEVDKVRQVAETLQSSKANGAITPTYHYGRLLQYEKDMRTMFPFNRSDIDKGIQEATGVSHTAQEYYNSITRDINSFLTNKDKEQQDLISETRQRMGASVEGVTAADVINKVKAGQMSHADAWKWNYNADHQEWSNKQTISNANAKEKILADAKVENTATAQSVAHSVVTETQMAVAKKQGLDSYEKLMDRIANPTSPQQAQADAEAYATLIPKVSAEIDRRLNEPLKDKGGNIMIDPSTGKPFKTMAQMIGPEGIQQVKTTALAQLQAGKAFIESNDSGPLAHFNNVLKAGETAFKTDIARSEAGNILMMGKYLKDMNAPEFLQKYIQTRLENGFLPMVNGVMDTLIVKSYFDKQSQLDQISPGAKLSSLAKDVQTVTENIGNTPKVRELVDDLPRAMSDPTTAPAMKVAKMNYALRNMDDAVDRSRFFRAWNRDGRPDMFKTMFSPAVVAEVKKLDGAYEGLGLFDRMKSTAQVMMKDMIGPDVLDLHNLQYMTGTEGATPPYRIKYTSDKGTGVHRFDVVDVRPGVIGQMAGSTTLNSARQMVERINKGISVMSSIAKADGSNPDEFILNTLRDYGYDPGDKAAQTFPEDMVNQVKAIYGPQQSTYKKSMEDIYNKFGTTFKQPPGEEEKPTPKIGLEPPGNPTHVLYDKNHNVIERRSGLKKGQVAMPARGANVTVPQETINTPAATDRLHDIDTAMGTIMKKQIWSDEDHRQYRALGKERQSLVGK